MTYINASSNGNKTLLVKTEIFFFTLALWLSQDVQEKSFQKDSNEFTLRHSKMH